MILLTIARALACAALLSGTAAAQSYGLATELVADGLEQPLFVTSPPHDADRLFVLEQNWARIRIIEDGEVLAEPFLDLQDPEPQVSVGGERGLLGLAFHPGYENNGLFFLNYTDLDGDTVVARYAVDPGDPRRALPDSGTPILTFEQDQANHNGGMLAFSPVDGYLYIGTGDGGGGSDARDRAQDLGSLLGKLLRINVDVETGYAIPPDNPFVDDDEARDEIWAYGLRNPWRFSFDRETGDLYMGDVGQNAREEINVQPTDSSGGENYGWPIAEGFACRGGDGSCGTDPGLTPPVLDYPLTPDQRASVTGGYVFRGRGMPYFRGRYIFGDFMRGTVESFRLAEGEVTELTDRTAELDPPDADGLGRIASFGEDARGSLYIVSHSPGAVYRIAPDRMVGDINEDGVRNASDVQLAINAALGLELGVPDPGLADVHQTGAVNAADIQWIINAVLGVVD